MKPVAELGVVERRRAPARDAGASVRAIRVEAKGNQVCRHREQPQPPCTQNMAACDSQIPSEASAAVQGRCWGNRNKSCAFPSSGTTRVQRLASGFDYTMSPRWLTDFRFAWMRERILVFPGGQGTSPATDAGIPGLPPQMRLPTVDAWNATVQHQLRQNMSIEVGYVGNKGTHVFAGDGPDYNPNQPTIVGFTDGVDTFHREPFYNKFGWTQNLRYFGNNSNNNYQSLQTKFEKRFSSGHALMAHYTLARVRNHDGDYWPIDGRVEYAPTDWQRTHVFVLTHIYELPFGWGKKFLGHTSRAADLLVGGWQVNGSWIWQSRRAFTPNYQDCGIDRDTGPCRPDKVGDASVPNPNQHQWFQIAPVGPSCDPNNLGDTMELNGSGCIRGP